MSRAVGAREPGGDAAGLYQKHLERSPLLNAEQELALGREIERLKLERWCALLSYRPALGVVLRVLTARLPRGVRKLQALRAGHVPRLDKTDAGADLAKRWGPAVVATSKQLLALDVDRLALAAADEAVRAAFAEDGRARAYLARIANVRDAEQKAKARFVAANFRLVISMARRHARPGLLPLSDLIQEGNLGLIRAVERFDYRRGHRFSTYATWWIRHHLSRATSDTARLVRVPVHALDALAQADRIKRLHAAKTGAEPAPAEVARQLGLSEQRFEQLHADVRVARPLSMDRAVGNEGEQTLHEILPASGLDPDQSMELSAWRDAVPRLLDTLPPIEAAVLRYRFGLADGEELTLREIGAKYNLSRERIRQLQQLALEKLRHVLAPGLGVEPQAAETLAQPQAGTSAAA